MKKTVFLAALLAVFLLGAKDQILLRQPQECFIGLHDNQVHQCKTF